MLNIKNYKSFGRPRTWKKIVEYDWHVYKKDDEMSYQDLNGNITLVDNILEFENDLKEYKKDLYETYEKETHINRRKTKKEMDKQYYSSAIMRSFRVSINHIELQSLVNPNDNPYEQKQIVIKFYQDLLNEFIDTLNRNNKFKQKVKVVLADIHFDQTSPHIHIHISNLRQRYLKKLNRQSWTCNYEQSDILRILKSEKSKFNCQDSINEWFSQKLRAKINNANLVNKIDLKKLFPDQYDLQLYKLKNKIKNINENNIKNESYEIMNWKRDKKISFLIAKETLKYLNLNVDSDDNKIHNRKKMDDVISYCWKQTIAQAIMNYQRYQYDLQHINDKNNKTKDEFKFDLSKINENEFVDKVIKESYELGLNIFVFNPKNLKICENILLSNISQYCPELKNIEKELINSLNLFKKLNQEQILNNQNVINQQSCSFKKIVEKNLNNQTKENDNKMKNSGFLLSSYEFNQNKENNVKKKLKDELSKLDNYLDDNYELLLNRVNSEKVENTDYVKLKNIYDLEKEEKFKQFQQLSR